MRTASGYKTRQRTLIEQAVSRSKGHFTVDSILEMLGGAGESVGRTTVYRCLEKLEKDGKVRKFSPSGNESCCYQAVNDAKECGEHFHLKCIECGKLIHMECEHLDELCKHINTHHGFRVDALRTVLYGLCQDCAKK